MANERLDRFTKLLKEIFELDKSDLDFGIYRVMNLRKTQIETFLTERLPQMVQETLAPFAQGRKEEIRTQMTQIEENVAGMDMTIDALSETAPMKQKYIALQKQLAEGADLAALETDVYSALYSFFNRYYEEGDFISKRRYKEGVYAIPYGQIRINITLRQAKTSKITHSFLTEFLSISAWLMQQPSRITIKKVRTISVSLCSLPKMKKTIQASRRSNMMQKRVKS